MLSCLYADPDQWWQYNPNIVYLIGVGLDGGVTMAFGERDLTDYSEFDE